MEEEVWGVFIENSGEEYLVTVFETEEEAFDYAVGRDERAYDDAVEQWRDEGAVWVPEEFEGTHKVKLIHRDLVDFGRLSRGFAQRTS
jgi:hypothetical protein